MKKHVKLLSRVERKKGEHPVLYFDFISESGKQADLKELCKSIERRDASDKNRTVGPLTPADDAIVIDTTNMVAQQAVEKVAEYIK